MFSDVVDLHEFYQSHLGHTAQYILRRKLREIWPDVTGQSVVGVGYATPYLRPFMAQASRVCAIMPAGQGVIHWPREEPGLTLLADEAELPLPDLSVDRLLLIHSVECSEQLRRMLRECWRVLAGNGKLLVMESVIDPGNDPFAGKFVDLVMLLVTGGKERTAEEFQTLYNQAGFELTRILPTESELSIIEGVKS